MARRRLGFWRRFIVIVVKPVLTLLTRRMWSGMEHIPGTGGAILAATHISQADPLVYAHFIYDAGRWPQYLAKSSLFKVPLLGWLLRQVRQIPVERGSVDAAKALDAAIAAVKAGDAVIFYPEGTTTKEPDLWPMRGKTGAARLALLTGVPVIPLVTWGPQHIQDPRTRALRIRPRMPVAVMAGPPIDLSRWAGAAPTRTTLHEMTEAIMLRLRDMVAELRGGTPPPLWSPASAGRNGVAGGQNEAASARDEEDATRGEAGIARDEAAGAPAEGRP